MDPTLLQKQVRDNANDLQNCLKDLKNWETEMKRKETELGIDKSACQPGPTNKDEGLCPVRNKIQKTGKQRKNKELGSLPESDKNHKPKKIASYDYASWDKFDVDKACEQIDGEAETSDEEEESENDDVESQRLHEEANYEKERGNQFVKSQKWNDAIQCYSQAIECYPYDAIFFANRALCYLKTSDLKSAETDCTSALNLDISYVKAFQRRAAARVGLGKLEEAKSDLEKVLRLEPKNAASKSELAKIEKKLTAVQTEAKSDPEKVIRLEPKYAASQSDLAKIKKKINVVQKDTKSLVNRGKRADQGSGEPAIASTSSVWSSSDEEGEIVRPIYKPPHLRSKVPLQRVDIQVVNNSSKPELMKEIKTNLIPKVVGAHHKDSKVIELNEEKITKEEMKTNSTPKVTPVEASSSNPVEQKLQTVAPHAKTLVEKKKTLVTIVQQKEESLDVPPPPNSYVEFYVGWKKVKRNAQQRFLYLKQTPGEELSKIFQESLESTTFSEIISTLEMGFLPKKEPMYPYLLGMSKVKRLSALTLFLTNEDKARMKMLLDSCEQSGECTKEEATLLSNKYEL